MKDEPEPEPKNTKLPVICRPVFMAVMWLAFGALALFAASAEFFSRGAQSNRRDEVSFLWFAGFFLVFPVLIHAGMGATGTIIADEKGLRWRHWLRWKSATWEEIRDFYHLRRSGSGCIVETPVGNLFFVQGTGSRAAALAALIAERATNAKARKWGVRGLRDVDTEPQVFRYGDAENWFFGGLYPFFTGVPVFGPFYVLLSGNLRWNDWIDIPFGLLLIGLLLTGVFWLSMVVAFIYCVNWGRENWQRRHETLEVSSQGIVWKNGDASLSVKWNQIQEFHKTQRFLQHSLYWLETSQGGLHFSHAISDLNLLFDLLKKYAPHLKIQYSLGEEERLRASDGQWSGGRPRVGNKTFHYRTRSNRAIVWSTTAFFLIPFFVMLIMPSDEQQATPPTTVALMLFSVSLFPTLFIWRWYCRAALCVSAEGLEQIGPFGKKFIAWPQVQVLVKQEEGVCCVKGAEMEILIRHTTPPPIDWEELKDEITRRAVNAQVRSWRER